MIEVLAHGEANQAGSRGGIDWANIIQLIVLVLIGVVIGFYWFNKKAKGESIALSMKISAGVLAVLFAIWLIDLIF